MTVSDPFQKNWSMSLSVTWVRRRAGPTDWLPCKACTNTFMRAGPPCGLAGPMNDRRSVVEGKRVSVRVGLGRPCSIKKHRQYPREVSGGAATRILSTDKTQD